MKTCNKCGKPIDFKIGFTRDFKEEIKDYQKGMSLMSSSVDIYLCTNPSCPNYGLYQVPMEDMPKKV